VGNFDVKAALETFCAERGWVLKPTLCHYKYHMPRRRSYRTGHWVRETHLQGCFAVAQWSTEGKDVFRIRSYRITIWSGHHDVSGGACPPLDGHEPRLEYGRSINQKFNLTDPTSLIKVVEIFKKIEDEVKAISRVWPWFEVEDHPWDGIDKALKILTPQTQDVLIKVERQ